MPTSLEQSVFRLLAYMAYVTFPVTAFEIWKWCDEKAVSLHDVMKILEHSVWLREHGLQECRGFWALGDVSAWRNERIVRVTDALRKSRRAQRVVRWASRLSWVRMIAVCNSLAHSFTTADSDIDLFIVTKVGRLWSTRLILTGMLAVFRLRPKEASRDPVCLSFFVDEEHIDLAPVKIGAEDPYLRFWIATLAPVIDRDNVMSTLRATNRWIRPALPRSHRVRRASAYTVAQGVTVPNFGMLEVFAERLQRSRFPQSLREKMNRDTRVVITSGMLKFHENDRREAIHDAQVVLCKAAGL